MAEEEVLDLEQANKKAEDATEEGVEEEEEELATARTLGGGLSSASEGLPGPKCGPSTPAPAWQKNNELSAGGAWHDGGGCVRRAAPLVLVQQGVTAKMFGSILRRRPL